MTKEQIINKLKSNHQEFLNYIDTLSETQFNFAPAEKWTAGQQLEHIMLSVKPLAQGFILPKFMLKIIFGTANRPSKTYDELVAKYKSKLESGGRASGAFIPKPVGFDAKNRISGKIQKFVNSICNQISSYSEHDLDRLIIPHPLLGKLTVREMLYFTIYHVDHHKQLTQRNLTLN
jgi:DinB superfamily